MVVGGYGDCFDRYAIRLNEVRESMAIVRQILDKMPRGDYRIQDRKVTPPPRGRIDESMEALIHHFKIFTEGFKVPEGEVYRAIESPRGELGCYMVSDGSGTPYRMHIRAPVLREPPVDAPHAAGRPHRRRGGGHLVGRPDHGRGRPLMPRFTTDNAAIADDIIARYPVKKSAMIPLLHLAQEQDGHVTDDAMEHIAELVDATPAEVLGTCSFYEMFKREPVGDYVVNVCTNISCMLLGGEELLHHLEQRLGIKAGDTTPDGKFTLEDVECIAACTEAPCLQVNYRYFHRISNDEVDVLIDDLRAGKRAHEVPRHGTLSRVRQQLPDTRAGVAPPDRNVEPVWLARNNETAPEASS